MSRHACTLKVARQIPTLDVAEFAADQHKLPYLIGIVFSIRHRATVFHQGSGITQNRNSFLPLVNPLLTLMFSFCSLLREAFGAIARNDIVALDRPCCGKDAGRVSRPKRRRQFCFECSGDGEKIPVRQSNASRATASRSARDGLGPSDRRGHSGMRRGCPRGGEGASCRQRVTGS